MSALKKQSGNSAPRRTFPQRKPLLKVAEAPKLSDGLSLDLESLEPATFTSRWVAVAIDAIALALVVQGLTLVGQSSLEGFSLRFFDNWVQFNVPIAYYISCYMLNNGVTLGKKLLKIRVVNLKDEEGEFPSGGRVIYREYMLKSLSMLLLGIGYLLPLFRQDKKALHDLIGETMVVKHG